MGKVQEHKRAAKSKRQQSFSTPQGKKPGHEDRFEFEGVVEECLPNTMFRVKITLCQAEQLVGKILLGSLAGKMRLFRIRVLPGDGVKGYISKYDLNKCKITYRSTQTVSQ
jgi:translation initiation factor IF-1